MLKKPILYLVRKRAMGDAFWMEPLIRVLATRVKKLVVYTKFPELFENYPISNVVIKKEIPAILKFWWKFERLLHVSWFFVDLELAYEKKPGMHILHAYQLTAGIEKTNEYPKLYLNNEESSRKIQGVQKFVTLHLESLTNRNYRKVYGVNWKQVVDYLNSLGYAVILLGKNPGSLEGTMHLNTGIREMISLINASSFFIGIDSGPSHLAASLNKPALIFFGAVNPVFRHFPEIFSGAFLQQDCPYAGCYHTVISRNGPVCRLVGDSGIPVCSLHSTEYVINHIDHLRKKYHLS